VRIVKGCLGKEVGKAQPISLLKAGTKVRQCRASGDHSIELLTGQSFASDFSNFKYPLIEDGIEKKHL